MSWLPRPIPSEYHAPGCQCGRHDRDNPKELEMKHITEYPADMRVMVTALYVAYNLDDKAGRYEKARAWLTEKGIAYTG